MLLVKNLQWGDLVLTRIDKKEQLLIKLLKAQKNLEEGVQTQNKMIKKFQTLTTYEGLFVQIIDYFPYPILVFSPAGILEMVNKALLEEIGVDDEDTFINKYNIFADSASQESEIINAVKRTLAGETVFLFDIKDPLKGFKKREKKNECSASCYDIVFFPILNNSGQVSYAAGVLIKVLSVTDSKEQEEMRMWCSNHFSKREG